MAGPARYTAVLDACVLYPVAVADALLSLAVAGLFAAKWTKTIEREWIESLEKQRPDLAGRLLTRRDDMRASIADWEIAEEPCARLARNLILPDPGDTHVLAAALVGHADCIVTTNLRDFPAEALVPYGIEALHPDDFIVAQIDLDEMVALAAFREMRARKRNPALDSDAFTHALERNGLVVTASRLRRASGLI